MIRWEDKVYEELGCGCILRAEGVIEMCIVHEEMWRQKKFEEDNYSEIDEWYGRLDEN